jgi:gas vesicle protein
MASMLNGTMSAAKNVMDSAREGAEQAFDSARHGTEHAVHGTRSALLDVVHTLGGLITTLRALDRDDALGWFGLARLRGPLPSIALFGAGMMMGAGIGVLFAPMSGAQMRSAILGRLKGVKEEAKRSADQVASEVKEAEKKVERKVEDLAGKAGDAVKKAEQKIETKVSAGAEAVKNAVDDAKSASATGKSYGQGGFTRHQS